VVRRTPHHPRTGPSGRGRTRQEHERAEEDRRRAEQEKRRAEETARQNAELYRRLEQGQQSRQALARELELLRARASQPAPRAVGSPERS